MLNDLWFYGGDWNFVYSPEMNANPLVSHQNGDETAIAIKSDG